MHTKGKRNGFTLLELVVTVAILAILVTVAVPTIRNVIQNSYAAGISNEFVATLNYARSEAVKRRSSITVCTSSNGSACRSVSDSDASNWQKGWIILDSANSNVMRYVSSLEGNATLTGSNSLQYQSNGAASLSTFTLTLPGCSGNNNRSIGVGLTGRVSVTRTAC